MTRTELTGIVGSAAAVLSVAILVSAPATAATLPLPGSECTLAVESTVRASTEPTVVTARLSEQIPGPITVSVDAESGVSVVRATPAREPGSLTVTLNTGEAKVGEWDITAQNEAGTSCPGKLRVVDGPTGLFR